MIGTVTGFIMMLGGFNEISFSDINASKELMRSLGGGMSTALYTTLTGLLCSVLLKIQYFNLSYEIERQT